MIVTCGCRNEFILKILAVAFLRKVSSKDIEKYRLIRKKVFPASPKSPQLPICHFLLHGKCDWISHNRWMEKRKEINMFQLPVLYVSIKDTYNCGKASN